MSVVFISYRRDDSSGHANTIYTALAQKLGEANLFFDKSTIQPGDDWRARLGTAIANAEIVVALIGKRWLSERLRQTNDYVRFELATALSQGIQVVPLLVDGAEMPTASSLPTDLRGLVGKQGYWLDHRSTGSYQHDLEQAVAAVDSRVTRVGTLQIERPWAMTGIATDIQVWIDGAKVGSVNNGCTEQFSVRAGCRSMYVRSGVSDGILSLGIDQRSERVEFVATPSETVRFSACFGLGRSGNLINRITTSLLLDRL